MFCRTAVSMRNAYLSTSTERDADRLESDGPCGSVSCHGVELVDDGLGLVIRDLAEDGVVAVEPRGRHGGDEELGAVGAVDLAVHAAAQAGVRHGQQVRAVEGQILGTISSSKS